MIYCKIDIKIKWEKYGVLSAAGSDNGNDNNNDDNIIFTIKDKVICACCNFVIKTQSNIIKASKLRIWKISLLEWI